MRFRRRCSSSSFLAAAVLLVLVVATDVAASVEVHFESKDGGFFLKHSPRQFYPSNLRPDLSISPALNVGSSTPNLNSGSTTSSSTGSTISPSSSSSQSSVLSVDKFTVFQTSEPVSVRASYGPFSTKQTVPARYIVPDPLDALPVPSLDPKRSNSSGPSLLDVTELGARHLDISAHLVSTSVPRDSPVLRVLFHAGSEASSRRQLLLGRQQRVCVVLHASPSIQPSRGSELGSDDLVSGPLTAACSPDGQDGVCLAQITVPASWWPALPPPDSAGRVKSVKTLPRLVQLSYSVLEPRNTDDSGHEIDSSSASFCQPRVQIQPLTPLGQVTLAPNRATYRELKSDEHLTLLVPHGPLYPRSRLHVPVFLQSHSSKQTGQPRPPVAAVVLRARVKAGVRILDASSSSSDWIVETDINTKNTAATFTARRKENVSRLPNASAEEIMTMLLEASDEATEGGKEHSGGRIVWSVRYALEGEEDNVSLSGPFQSSQQQLLLRELQREQQQQQQQQQHHHHHNGAAERKKLQAHLEIQKDDIQAVLPISKNWEVMNTAVLTGRQISQAMKVFIVSQAGTVADVTLQSSCHSEDESVLKVSSSCSSVYVDGSEIRGSSNASVLVKYGTYTGLARFTVWMPEFPLEVSVTDTRLNQIKAWKVPEEHSLSKSKRSLTGAKKKLAAGKEEGMVADSPSHLDDDVDYEEEDEDEDDVDGMLDGDEDEDELTAAKMSFRSGDKWDDMNAIDRSSAMANCRLRFQQSPVEVHARFLAADHDSGRVSYFVNRRTWLRVTDLVAGLLRVSDPRIAGLVQGRIVQGRGIGRTEVQVLSPITGRVIGAKEVRVGNDRVSISQLSVKVVSGLQLTISPDSSIENGYVAETSVTRKLTAKFQEGLLDIDIEFSDGSRTPLREIAVSDYQLVVESLDPDVVAFAPVGASHNPRVIAVGEGRGELLRVSLQLADSCRLQASPASASSTSSKPQQQQRVNPKLLAPTSRTSSSASAALALPLATATANVEVDFASSELPSRPEFVQNDGGGGSLGIGAHHRERKNGRDMAPDLHDILNGGVGGGGLRHHGLQQRMTPLEIGMYVLLAAFCFAIVVFVVSCVVFASKFKPQTGSEIPGVGGVIGGVGSVVSGPTMLMDAARAAASQFADRQNRRAQPRESTTNVHDWVWLGRATLERAACAPQRQVRVTSNPLANEPEDETMDLATSFDNPNHVELPSTGANGLVRHSNSTSSSSGACIDTTTYCKKDRTPRSFANKSQRNDNENTPPPPPPHKTPVSNATTTTKANDSENGNGLLAVDNEEDEDYKPPVPPHRNTGASSSRGALPETPKRKHHHHHHHQRANSGSERSTPSKQHHHHRDRSSKSGRSKQSSSSKSSAVEAHQVAGAEASSSSAPDAPLIEVRTRDPESRGRRARSREMKRSTIVGNPLFYSSSSNSSGSPTHAAAVSTGTEADQQQQQTRSSTTSSGAALDDLNLGMDYNQIMQYFDNLKESNA